MKVFHISNEGQMEEGIEMVIKLIRSKRKTKTFSIFVPSLKFAKIFIDNMERELSFYSIKNYDPKLELNIYVDEGDSDNDTDKPKENKPKR